MEKIKYFGQYSDDNKPLCHYVGCWELAEWDKERGLHLLCKKHGPYDDKPFPCDPPRPTKPGQYVMIDDQRL